MASIESLGIGSGLLTNQLVDDLVAAEREAADIRLENKTLKNEAQLTAYGTYKSVVSKLQTAAKDLADPESILNVNTKISNEDALDVETNGTVAAGNYQVNIDQLAQSHSLASKRFDTLDESVGTGTLSFDFGEYSYDGDDNVTGFERNTDLSSFEIELDSSNNTLNGIRDTINNADKGVSASIVNDGEGYRLLLTSEDTGKEFAMRIQASGTAGLDALAYNAQETDPANNMEETLKGTNAALSVNGLAITSTNNSITDVIDGVTLNITQTTDTALTLDFKRDTEGLVEKVDGFVNAYNEYRAVYAEVTKFDQSTNVGGLLNGDSTVRAVNTQVKQLLSSMVEGLESESVRSLADLGIYTDQDDGYQLKLNTLELTSALRNNADAVAGILATDVSSTDSAIIYQSKTKDTKAGTYDIVIDAVATQATFTGATTNALAFGSDFVVNGANDSFELFVDGSSFDVTLEQGSYASGQALADMLQTSINNSAEDGQVMNVLYDAVSQSLSLSTSRYGTGATIELRSADPSVATTLGLAPTGYGESVGSKFNTLGVNAFAASTSPGTLALAEEDGIDFSSNPLSFDIELTGAVGAPVGPQTITLDEDWSDITDLNGNVTSDRTRDDVQTYIQSVVDDAGFTGLVAAEFNDDGRLVLRSEPEAGTQTLAVTAVSDDSNLLGISNQSVDSGVEISADVNFKVGVQNRYGTATSAQITVPDGTYETSADLATAIETAINADGGIAGTAAGALTPAGSRNLINIDFSIEPAEFVISVNGQEEIITVDAAGDPATAINTALDAAFGADIVTANVNASGALSIVTDATGSSETIEILSDGRGARTDVGSEDLSLAAQDFATTNATFTLAVGGEDIDVVVDTDASGLTGTAAEQNLEAVQNALDEALASSTSFAPGDIVAKLDAATNGVYFETVSQDGEKTIDTFGEDASIEIKNVVGGEGADTLLGIADGVSTDGKDALGLDTGIYTGFDGQATVTYEEEGGAAGFNIFFDNQTKVTISDASDDAIAQIGINDAMTSNSQQVFGTDVEGTINGVEARGSGQDLIAEAGNEAATYGYVYGGSGWDFNEGPAIIDDDNNTLKVAIDGVESDEITIANGSYSTPESLTKALEEAINADAALKEAEKSVEVQYDENTNIYGIISTSRGLGSKVRLVEDTEGFNNIYGITRTNQPVDGKNADGEPNPAQGLTVRVTGNQTGSRGSVTYVQGIAEDLNRLLGGMLGSEGKITLAAASLEAEQAEIAEEKVELDARMKQVEERYKSQFLFNDKIISRLKTTESFLKQQFEAMAASRES